jgi:hypothetical protein
MKAYWGSGGVCPPALGGGEWSASRPGCFTQWERAPGTHWIGGWLGPGLDVVAKINYHQNHHHSTINEEKKTQS